MYLARHSMLRQQVALKLMRKQRLTDPKMAERFLREARAAAAVNHPHIVQMLDCGVVDGQPFLVMELLAGRDLADVLAARKRLTLGETIDIGLQSLDALGAAHARGIVHRDMKPSNVLLLDRDPDGGALNGPYVKLLDFGISKVLHEQTLATQGNSVLGTPAYMAPEQLLSPQSIDHRADLYALAVMLYEMLAGRLPFEGDSVGELLHRALTDRAPPLRALAPHVPELVAAVIERGLARDRDARWSSARAVKDALQRALRGEASADDQRADRATARLEGAREVPGSADARHERAPGDAARDGAHGTIASVAPPSLRPPDRPELELRPTRDPLDRAFARRDTRTADATSRWLLPVIALALAAILAVSIAAALVAWAWDRSQNAATIATLDPQPVPGTAGSSTSTGPAPNVSPVSFPPVGPPTSPPSSTGTEPVDPDLDDDDTTPTGPPTEPARPLPASDGPPWPADDPEPRSPPHVEWEGQPIGLRSPEQDGVRFEVVRITAANPAEPTAVLRGLVQLRPHFVRCRPTGRSQLVRMRVITQYDGRASIANADERNPGSAEATRCALGAVNAGPVFPRVNEIITFDVLLRRR